MSYQITYQNYAEALYQALKKDAFYITMEASLSNAEVAKQAMLKYLDFSIVESEKYGVTYFPDDQSFGVSEWSVPLEKVKADEKSQENKTFIREEMGEASLFTYSQLVDFMSGKADAVVSPNDWYLSIVGILIECQGQGFGRKAHQSGAGKG